MNCFVNVQIRIHWLLKLNTVMQTLFTLILSLFLSSRTFKLETLINLNALLGTKPYSITYRVKIKNHFILAITFYDTEFVLQFSSFLFRVCSSKNINKFSFLTSFHTVHIFFKWQQLQIWVFCSLHYSLPRNFRTDFSTEGIHLW